MPLLLIAPSYRLISGLSVVTELLLCTDAPFLYRNCKLLAVRYVEYRLLSAKEVSAVDAPEPEQFILYVTLEF